MKKLLLYVLGLFLLIGSALALTVPSSVDFEQTDANKTTAVKSFTITANGETVTISSTADSKYNVVFSTASDGTYTSTLTDLVWTGDKTIYVKASIPDEEKSGIKTIGNIIVNSGTSYSIPLKVTVRGRLNIGDFDATMGEKKETHNNLKDGDKINKNLKPGDPFEFNIKIENTFSKTEDIDINNIVITLTISGIDDGEDFEEETSEFDLNPDESHSETFSFKTPVEVDEGDYAVMIDIEGEDDNGKKREASLSLTLQVEKESHDVQIRSAVLSPTKIICGGTAVLSTTIYNFGKNSEDEVRLKIKNSELGINIDEFPIELGNELLEDDSKLSKSYAIPVSKQASGLYPIEIWLYYNDDVLDDYRKLELNAEKCEEEKPAIVCGNSKVEAGEDCDDGNTANGDGCSSLCKKEQKQEEEPPKEEEKTPGTTITTITETKEEGASTWIIALVGVNVLVLLIVTALVYLMFRKKWNS